jgi:predicted phage terminase large subunit-like protein
MTRWHQDDLVGRILKYEGDIWEHIQLPAIAVEPSEFNGYQTDPLGREPGEPLWPGRVPLTQLMEWKATNEYWWNAMYQQRPTPEGGSVAQATWFKGVPEAPGQPRYRVRYWDCASTEATNKSDPDYTVGALVSEYEGGGKWCIEHIIRGRWSAGEVDELIKDTARRDGRNVWIREEQEPGSAGKAVIAHRLRSLAGYNYQGVPVHGPKVVRWMPMLIQAQAGNVTMKDGPWVQPFLDEAMVAPYGTHDDQLDAVAGAFVIVADARKNAVQGIMW